MKSRFVLSVLAAVLVISALSFAGVRYVRERSSETCSACQRPAHVHTRTIAVIDGKQKTYCCPACALSEHRQTQRTVDVRSLTDYLTGAAIPPDRAFLVRGSDVHSCGHAVAMVGLDKHPMQSQFDRCSPGLLAFSGRSEAEGFARKHGGQVVAFTNFAALYR
jgi:hypothetical protein